MSRISVLNLEYLIYLSLFSLSKIDKKKNCCNKIFSRQYMKNYEELKIFLQEERVSVKCPEEKKITDLFYLSVA